MDRLLTNDAGEIGQPAQPTQPSPDQRFVACSSHASELGRPVGAAPPVRLPTPPKSLAATAESATTAMAGGADDDSLRPLALLSEIANALSLQLDLRQLMETVVNQGARLLSAEQAIGYANRDEHLQRISWFPRTSNDWPPAENLADDAIHAITKLEPVLTRPVFNGPFNKRRTTRVRNAIYIPVLATQNRLLGLIEFRNKRRGGFFNQHDLETAQFLGRIAASALDRARLFDRIEEWSRSIEMLLSFNATASQPLKPQEMVRRLVANAIGFVDADGGAAGLAIYQKESSIMECDAICFDQRWHSFNRRWEMGSGIPGTVMQTEFPLLIDDYSDHPLAENEINQQFPIGPSICVAIKNTSERVLGFFQLFRRTGKPCFTWQEAALLETLGNTAAVAIENARLVKSLEHKNEQVKNLSAAHVRRLEQERQHIARELHDETGQVLIGLKLRLQLISHSLLPDQSELKQDIGLLRQQINEAAVRLKDLAKLLRPPTLDELGFEATLKQLLADYRQQSNFEIDLIFDTQAELDKETETTLYRIVQESLTNIAKHAKAKFAVIRIYDHQHTVAMEIEDDGRGFDIEQASAGLGLIGIQERVKMLDARFEIKTGPGQGTQIRISQISGYPIRSPIQSDS